MSEIQELYKGYNSEVDDLTKKILEERENNRAFADVCAERLPNNGKSYEAILADGLLNKEIHDKADQEFVKIFFGSNS